MKRMDSQGRTHMALFELNDKSSIPLWVQMKNRFIYLITSGYYKTGQQLPTVRGLAAEIKVNYNTVNKVYKSLEEDGYIESRRRQGSFVCDVSDKQGVSAALTAENVTRDYFTRCLELGMSLENIEDIFTKVLRDNRINMKREVLNEENAIQASSDDGRVINFDHVHASKSSRKLS